MADTISRRKFLTGGLAGMAGLAVGGLPLPRAARAALPADGEQICTLLDLSKCIGCEACVEACRDKWQATVPDPVKPIPEMFPAKVPVADFSKRKDIQDRLTPYNFLYVEMLEIEHKGESVELNVPRRCMHCINPPCVNLCPFGSGRLEKNGIVHIDKDICFGGAKCKSVCPWNIPQRQSGVGLYLDILPAYAGNGVMFKCHRCLDLVKKGETPRCIEECPEDVQQIGGQKEMTQKAVALAKQKAKADGSPESDYGRYLYGLNENGGTRTLYVSPIPFEKVNQAVLKQHKEQARLDRAEDKKAGRRPERGDLGRPHMGPAANTMENEENLGLALLLAPIAGVAAGAAGLFSRAKKSLNASAANPRAEKKEAKDVQA